MKDTGAPLTARLQHFTQQYGYIEQGGLTRPIWADEHLKWAHTNIQAPEAAIPVRFDTGNHDPGSGLFLRNSL